MNGILVIDKTGGMTSFDVVRQVRRLCGTRRVGHTGTLDPMATGVLPVAVGSATRLVEYLMAGTKCYRATLVLGATTDTLDSEGRVLKTYDWRHVDRAALDSVLPRFRGTIEQLPPMYSALKREGTPLYRLARQGVEVERQPRQVQIDSLDVDVFDPPWVTFTVRCSKGTYVRTLCDDIGRALSCGAHMTALRRLASGVFDLAASHTLEQLQEMAARGERLPLLTPAQALADWPGLAVAGAALERLRNGVAPRAEEVAAEGLAAGDSVRLMAGDELVSVARFAPGGEGQRGGDFEILKVFPMVDNAG